MKRVVIIATAIALCISLCAVLTSCGELADAVAEGFEEGYEDGQKTKSKDEDEYYDEEEDEYYDEEEDEYYDEDEDYEEDEDEYYDEDEDEYYDDEEGSDGTFYTGMAGDESTAFVVCLSVDPDGMACVFGVGTPGSSQVVLGQYIADRNNITIKPFDGSEEILLKTRDNADGSVEIEFVNHQGETIYSGSMEPASESKFNETLDMLS